MRSRVVKGREGLMFYIWVFGEVHVVSDHCDNMLRKEAKFIAQMLLGDLVEVLFFRFSIGCFP